MAHRLPFIATKVESTKFKWRVLVNKHFAPSSPLHTAVGRAIDVILDFYPAHLWTDFMSMMSFTDYNAEFDALLTDFLNFSFNITAGDMVDCFHHIPCQDCVEVWSDVVTFCAKHNIYAVSVPVVSGNGPGRLGVHQLPGWVVFQLHDTTKVLFFIYFFDESVFLTTEDQASNDDT